MANGQFELGRVTGVRVVMNVTFLLTFFLFLERYLSTWRSDTASFGVLFMLGIALSVLVHELAHAHVGRWRGMVPTHVELNGLGGLCYFAGGQKVSIASDVLVSLAGPASNLVLWGILSGLSDWAQDLPPTVGFLTGIQRTPYLLAALASANLWMFWFNLLPAFPLDGGNALSALLSTRMSPGAAKRMVAMTGMGVAVLCLALAARYGVWMLILAIFIYIQNKAILDMYQPPGRR